MSCSIIRNNKGEIERVLAPNGKESILFKSLNDLEPDKESALRLWAQVYTPSFKAWFGDWEKGEGSKAVDENGEPLIVYHGSTSKFNSFSKELLGSRTSVDTASWGFYFTTNKKIAEKYLPSIPMGLDPLGYEEQYEPDYTRGQMISSFLNIRTPKVLTSEQFELVQGNGAENIKFNGDGINIDNYIYIALEPNQIKSVFNKGEFSSDNNNIYYSKDEIPTTKADAKTIALSKQILKSIGVDIVTATRSELKEMGIRTDWAGMADMVNKLVLLVEGRENVAITEEMAHFAVEIVKQTNPKLYRNMFNKIANYPIYNEVKNSAQYRAAYRTTDNKLDIPKLKDEAIGKLISELFVKEVQGESDLDNLVTPVAQDSVAGSWWEQIVNWFKELFSKVFGVSESNPYKELVKYLTEGTFEGTVDDIVAGGEFYQLENEAYNKIRSQADKIIKTSNGKFTINNKEIKNIILSSPKGDLSKKDEYLEKVNKLGKQEISNILKSYINEDGILRENPLPLPTAIIAQPAQALLNDSIVEKLRAYPEGTRFLYNSPVYSPIGDAIAVVDFIAITPEGKTDILTFDFLSSGSKDISSAQRQRLLKYIGDIKSILNKSYDIKDFGRTRSIPIQVNFNYKDGKYSLTKMAISSQTAETEDNLKPLPTPDELTGDKKIDALIGKLNALYTLLQNRAAPEGRRDIKNAELHNIFSAIRNLQIDKNFAPLFEQIKNIIDNTDELLKSIADKVGTQDTMSKEEEQDISAQLNSFEEYLAIYRDIDNYFRGYFNEDEQDNWVEIQSLASGAKYTYESLKEQRLAFVKKFIAGKFGISGLEEPEKIYKGLVNKFNTLSESPIAAMQTLYKMVNNTAQRTIFEVKELLDELTAIKNKLTKEDINLIKKGDKNELIDEYKREFYDTLKNKVAERDIKWIKDNIDTQEFEQWAKDYRAKKLEELEDITPSGDVAEQLAQKQQWKDEILSVTDLSKDFAWLQYNNIRRFPIDSWQSEEYKTLSKSPAIELFNFISKLNRTALEVGYLDHYRYRNFLPFIRKSLFDKMVAGENFNPIPSLLESLTIDENVEGYGNINPLTGEVENTIPIYFTKEIDSPSEDLYSNLALYLNVLTNYKNKSEIEQQSRLLYYVEKNKQSIQTNFLGNIIRENGEALLNDNNEVNSKLLFTYIKNQIYSQAYPDSEVTDVLLGNVGKKYNTTADKINDTLGVKILPHIKEDSQLSLTRLVEGANRLFQMKVLGFNALSSISNFFGGNFQAIINSGRYFTKNEFVTSEFELVKALGIRNNPELTVKLIEEFIPLTEGNLHERLKDLSLYSYKKYNVQDAMMLLMRKGDHAVQYTIFLSMLKNAVVIDNQLVNAREYIKNSPEYANRYSSPNQLQEVEEEFNDKVAELISKHGFLNNVKVVNGKLITPEYSQDSFFKYRSLIQSISKSALGNISPDDIAAINLNIIGKSFMVFKNWIPPTLKTRFSALKYNSGSDKYEYGRARMLVKMIAEHTGVNLKKLHDVAIANERGVDILTTLYQQKKKDYEDANNKPFNMTQAEFNDMVRQNLSSQLKDTILLFSLWGLFLYIKANSPDDDADESTKAWYRYNLRTIDKVSDELLFYYSPMQLQQMVGGSIFPSIGVISDAYKVLESITQEGFGIGFTPDGLVINDDEVREKAHPAKYIMRALPISNQFLMYLSLINTDFAKEMGVKISSQSRHN